jgi:hypothetical protein
MYSCMKKEKWDLLKRFRNGGGGIKDNDGEMNSTMIYKNFGKW